MQWSKKYNQDRYSVIKKINYMNFGSALEMLNSGQRVARAGWNGKNMFIYKTVGNTVSKYFIPKFASLPDSVKIFLEKRGSDVVFQPSLTMYTAAGEMQPGWLASQSDMLAEDWTVLSM
jgi:uncharacterized protein DUF2829